VTASSGRIGHVAELDGLRALAIGLVLAEHAGYLPVRFGGGPVGVTVFFVLSGFLITSVLLRRAGSEDPGLLGFYRARAVRLLPALVLMLAIATPLAVICGERFGRIWPAGVTGLLYVHNFYFARHAVTVFSPLWSLSVEEQFYLLWPLLLALLVKWRSASRRVVLVLAAASVLLHVAVLESGIANHEQWAYTSFPTNSCGLLLGAWLALRPDLTSRKAPAWVVPASLAGIAAVMLTFRFTYATDYMTMVVPLFAAPLIWGLLSGNPIFRVAPVRFVGRISYSLYLWHWPLLWMLTFPSRGVADVPGWVTILIAAAVGTASTLLVEEPLRRRWKRTTSPTSSRLDPARAG
jgi:peptidoglycan/LPS O-acetylase OafA/YrhL